MGTEHVVVNTAHGGAFHCLHCGAHYKPTMPAPIDVYLASMAAFKKDHQRCKLRPEGESCEYCYGFGHKPEECPSLKCRTPQEWLDGPDTGISSETICRVLLGGTPSRARRPQDAADFGRCYRLLALFPDFRPRLHEVADKFPEWAPLVREWESLTKLYEEELPAGRAPKLYARMKDLLAEGDAAL